MRSKISIIGAGNVGATTALRLVETGLFDIALVDILPGVSTGKALDLSQAAAISNSHAKIEGGAEFEITANSDIIVITAGFPRIDGITRDDLLLKNAETVAMTVREVMAFSNDPILLVVTNPLDAMCHVALQVSGLTPSKVIGMAGVLDSSRFKRFIADELNVSVSDINAMVLGGHGETMVPLPRYSTVSGVPVTDLLKADRITAIIDRTRAGGTEIVSYLKDGGAYYAPSAAILEMVLAIHLDENRLLPCSALLEGQFGIDSVYLGVPCVLGATGLVKILELELSDQELQLLNRSAAAVQLLRDKVRNFA